MNEIKTRLEIGRIEIFEVFSQIRENIGSYVRLQLEHRDDVEDPSALNNFSFTRGLESNTGNLSKFSRHHKLDDVSERMK